MWPWKRKRRDETLATATNTGTARADSNSVANTGTLTVNQYLLAHPDAPLTLDHEAAITTYAERLRQQYGRADLEVLTPPSEQGEHPPMQLREIFVPQDVRAELPPLELPKELMQRLMESGDLLREHEVPDDVPEYVAAQFREKYQRPPRLDVLEALASPSSERTVLLGDPGAGKSTLVRYLALALVSTADIGPLAPLSGRLPLLVELRRYAEELWRERTFEEFLNHLHRTEGLSVPPDVLRERLESGSALVVFDGLDEIFAPSTRAEVTRRIAHFAACYPAARVLVTSRVIGYRHEALEGAGFTPQTLQDLTDTQIEKFASRWYRNACPYDEGLREQLERRLAGAVAHSGSVRELAGNPLLLTILAIIGRRQSLPRDRKGVYEHAVTVLVARWDQDVKFLPDQATPVAQAPLDMNDRLELLRLVARRMQHGAYGIAGNHIHGNELEETFRTYLEESLDLPRVQATATARALVKQLRERNFILSLYGGEVYGFVHRAFLEYLAALDIAHRYKEERAWTPEELMTDVFGRRYARDTAWHEVLLLVTGQLGETDAARVVDHFLSLHRASPMFSVHGSRMLTLAVRALAEVRKVGRLHAQSVGVARAMIFQFDVEQHQHGSRGPLAGVLPSLSTFNEQWVGRAHYLRWFYRRGFVAHENPEATNIACYLYANSQVPRLLAEFAATSYRRAEVLEVLAERWPRDPETFALVQAAATATLPTPATVGELLARDRAVRLLAKHWPEHHNAQEPLDRVSNRKTDLTSLAAELLPEELPTQAAALRTALAKAMATQNPNVRLAVLTLVRTRLPHHPETLALLRQHAARDSHHRVRAAAMKELARHWPQAEGTWSLLTECVANESHDHARQRAISCLGMVARVEPRARDALQEMFFHDEAVVRGSALAALTRADRTRADLLQVALRHAADDPDLTVRGMAASLLLRNARRRMSRWRDQPRAKPLIQRHVLDVASAAPTGWTPYVSLHRLVATWPDDAEVWDVVRKCATVVPDPPHAGTRESALTLLAAYWPDDPATHELLLGRVTEDPHEEVRLTALQLWAAAPREDDSGTCAVVCERAEADPSPHVRVGAMYMLGFAWPEDARARERLATSAANDPDSDVREAAGRAGTVAGRMNEVSRNAS